jgi:hypothetical protein
LKLKSPLEMSLNGIDHVKSYKGRSNALSYDCWKGFILDMWVESYPLFTMATKTTNPCLERGQRIQLHQEPQELCTQAHRRMLQP